MVSTIGSPSAGDQFTTLEGIAAQDITPMEMERVAARGLDTFSIVVGNQEKALAKSNGKAGLGLLTDGAEGARQVILGNPSMQ